MTADIDLAIIGAGPAGLAAGARARQLGLKDVVVFDRDERLGGILSQCIHSGFGLMRYGEELTGPEYALREIKEAKRQGVEIELNSLVTEVKEDRHITVVSPLNGLRRYNCKSVIFAMGCRERTRPAVRIPGTRPAGIYTAGKAQRLVNIEGYKPGKRIVIVGSGDIGMIMARRLTLEGCDVEAVIEINPFTSGLIRNEVQCLRDFNIPLLLNHEVTEIRGANRVEEITVTARDDTGNPIRGMERIFPCDTLLLSVGLIPENELSRQVGFVLDSSTSGPMVNNILETAREGFFACGNVLHVNDLVDEVSKEGEIAAEGAFGRLSHTLPPSVNIFKFMKGANIGQVVPQQILFKKESRIAIRVCKPTGPVTLRIGEIVKKRLSLTRPGEMINIDISADQIQALADDNPSKEVKIECD
ncbi:FAD-dependent pyridine nucleotide-disulfide oxidoreductase [uncultured Spirochaetota bacterium]|nr:FAD-dependent pyridine nucleotide-disulfide oxidoreductase [uncultured Spirochaetota bacterium]